MEECGQYLVRKGDLLIGMSGSLGKIGRYVDEEAAVQNQRTGLLQVKPGFTAGFAKLVLKLVEPQIIAEGKGVAVQNVSAKEIEDCTFPLPPAPERECIVEEIEKQFTRADAGVASLKRVQRELKRYRASVLKAACEGRLVPTEAEVASKENRSYETGEQLLQRILKERREKWSGKGRYKDPATPTITQLGKLPQGWTWATIDQLYEVKYGLSEPLSKTAPESSADLPVIRIANVKDTGSLDLAQLKYFQLSSEERQKLLLRKGDLLFNWRNAPNLIGKTAVFSVEGQFVNASFLLRLRPPNPTNDGKFVWLYLNFLRANGHFALIANAAVNQSNFNASRTAGIPVPLPPLVEQERIVAEVEKGLSVVEGLEALVSTNLQRAKSLRQSILQRAFSG
jgi:type I restriction enzyme S subunit